MTTHSREGWFRNDGLNLRFIEWGQPSAPVIVALHGLRSFAYTWEPVALPLADRFRIIALDQRGRGQSDWDPAEDYYVQAYVRDLEGLVGTLGLQRFLLIGHSMGGSNALVYATRHPEHLAGLVIEDIGPGSSGSSAGAERIRRELKSTPDGFPSWEEASAFWRWQRPGISESALQARVLHSMREVAGGGVVWRHDSQGIARARLAATPAQLVDLWPHVLAIKSPTLLLRGAHSDFLAADTADEMVRRNALIRRIDVPSASHYVHDDNLHFFEQALHEFIDSAALKPWSQGAGR